MTEKRFKAKRHCTDGNCRNFVLDKPNHRFVLMVSSWEDCKDVCELLNELADENRLLELEDERWVKASEHDQEVIDRLRKENEQLKCGNKNLKTTLNDFINILNRLQANPTDKQTVAVARDMLQNMGKELEE